MRASPHRDRARIVTWAHPGPHTPSSDAAPACASVSTGNASGSAVSADAMPLKATQRSLQTGTPSRHALAARRRPPTFASEHPQGERDTCARHPSRSNAFGVCRTLAWPLKRCCQCSWTLLLSCTGNLSSTQMCPCLRSCALLWQWCSPLAVTGKKSTIHPW